MNRSWNLRAPTAATLGITYSVVVYLVAIEGTNHTDQRFLYNLALFRTVAEAFQSESTAPLLRVAMNLLVVVPVALIIVLLERIPSKMGRATLIIFGSSLLIELLQLALNTGRSADVDDLILNTLGGCAAYVLLSRLTSRSTAQEPSSTTPETSGAEDGTSARAGVRR